MTAGRHDALVLAGGRSRRMGVAKLGLVVAGDTLLTHACVAVQDARRLVVVGPPDQPGIPSRAIAVREDPPFGGPAAAIAAGLSGLGTGAAERVVVLAADVPRAGEAVPVLLAALDAEPDADGVVARSSDGHRQPLVAVYRTAALRSALAAHEPLAGSSVMRVIAGLALTEIDLPDDVLADVDTPADLHRITEERPHG
ncbi:MAG: molybdopterin-guanine dinucleotide biosynthesis protein [Aeromicrobium sp.]|nr:molybdopterin-guanine dinucleotide biosynthesis protein [Aeromicrobium sp.]